MKRGFIAGLVLFVLFIVVYAGASNFDRLVLGSGNYGTDPNTTADITFQNDEYISNVVDGTLNFGAANLTTTGSITGGATSLTGNVSFGVDSSKGIVLAASDSTLWRIKVSPLGALSADSTGLN